MESHASPSFRPTLRLSISFEWTSEVMEIHFGSDSEWPKSRASKPYRSIYSSIKTMDVEK